MESDLNLIQKIKDKNDNDSIKELINRHSGIYHTVFSKYYKNDFKSINSDISIEDKDYIIYSTALTFDPSRETKFSTYLANETRWKCLSSINKSKRKKESYIEDMEKSPDPSCEDFIGDVIKKEALDIFYQNVNKEKDKRIGKIIDMRYNTCNSKLLSWKVISQEMNMSIQGCINIHNKFIEKYKKQ